MKVLGLIVEYNPFHNGHKYHLNKAKEMSDATHVVAVMSGNFLQRGEPALLNKWLRAEMALCEGVDLIIELPVVYACNSAELFAYGAVSLLHQLNVVDVLCFGSEVGQTDGLIEIAKILAEEPEEYQDLLKKYLSNGVVYPKARQLAIEKISDDDLHSLVQSPNNILGVEYIKALLRLNSKITPMTLTRMNASYNSIDMVGNICSATAIRNYIYRNKESLEYLESFMPPNSFNILTRAFGDGLGPIFYAAFNDMILYNLRTSTTEEIKIIQDVVEGLENRIKDASMKTADCLELLKKVKTKRYTMTKLQRVLIHSLLKIKEKDIVRFNQQGGSRYARILGFTDKGAQLIKKIKTRSSIPVITNINKEALDCEISKKMMSYDIMATDIYTLGYPEKSRRIGGWDYYEKPIIV
ncbi:MAG: nucleotidyltransferase [Bacillota bacterium]